MWILLTSLDVVVWREWWIDHFYWSISKFIHFWAVSEFVYCSKQERLEFLYDSGLAVGKGSSDGFKALETLPRTDTASTSASTSTKVSSHRYKQCYTLYTINMSWSLSWTIIKYSVDALAAGIHSRSFIWGETSICQRCLEKTSFRSFAYDSTAGTGSPYSG